MITAEKELGIKEVSGPRANDMLGGNQNNEVNSSKYDKSVWKTFVVPSSYTVPKEIEMPIYKSKSTNAGNES